MKSEDPDGSGPYALHDRFSSSSIPPKSTSTSIKAKFYDRESERELVGMAVAWPDHAAEIVGKLDVSHLGDDLSKKAIVVLRKLLAVNGVVTAKTVAENLPDWPTALIDLNEWVVDAPFFSERELNSRVLSIRAASDNRQLYKAGEMLRESLESGDGGSTKAALSLLNELSQLAESATSGVDLSPLQVNFSVLFSKETPRREYLIGPWLAAGSATKIYSPPKVGKSLLTLELAVVLATGRAGLGMDARAPISVLYLDYENTADDLLDRLESMGFDEADDLSNLHYFQLAAIPPLDTREGGEWIREAKKEFEPQLVVIDTTARAVAGEENSADTYRKYYLHVGLFLKSQKITVLELDHAGKDTAKGPRGSSDKSGYVDAVYRLSANGNRVTLKCEAKRIDWLADEVKFTKLSDPLRHVPDNQPFTPQGIDFAKTLDDLDISIDATRREITDALKAAGIASKRGVAIDEAQKIRRERANRTGRDTFKKSGQSSGQAFGTKLGTSSDKNYEVSQNCISTSKYILGQSSGQAQTTQRDKHATLIEGALSSAGFEDDLETAELTDQWTPQSDPTCKVCGNALLFPASVSSGICARRDEAHQTYNGQEEPHLLSDISDDYIAGFDDIDEAG